MDDLAQSQFEKAFKLVQERQYQQAIKLCRLILLAHPKYVECRLLLTKSLLALARYDDVLGEAQILLDLMSDEAEVYSIKGEAHFFKGEFVAAHAALRKAAALNPSDRKVQRLLADIEPSMETGGADPAMADDPAATRSYPLAEQVTEIDPTEMMESPPVVEPWDEEDEAVGVPGVTETTEERVGQEDEDESEPRESQSPFESETVARHGVSPALLAASRRPDGDRGQVSSLSPLPSRRHHEAGSDKGATTPPTPMDNGGGQAVARSERADGRSVQSPEAETVPSLGRKLKATRALVEGVEEAAPVEEGPRGAVVKFLPSDQLVTVEQVGITTGEIQPTRSDSVFDLGGDDVPLESSTSEAGTVSLKVKTPSKADHEGERASRPSVEIEDAGLLAKPRRLRPLARHRGRLPDPGRQSPSNDGDGMEDAPTTPHLDISNVGAVPVAKGVRRPSRGPGVPMPGPRRSPTGLDLGLEPAAPARLPGSSSRPPLPSPPSLPRGREARMSPSAGRVAQPPPVVPSMRPGRLSGDGSTPRPPLVGSNSAVRPSPRPTGPSMSRRPGSGDRSPTGARPKGDAGIRAGDARPTQRGAVGSQASVHRSDTSSRSGGGRQSAGPSAVASADLMPGSRPDVVQRSAGSAARRSPGSRASARLGVNRGVTGVTSVPRRRKTSWWRRRSIRIGGAVTGVVFVAALAGWFYVRWMRAGQASRKRARALALTAKADPEGLLAARFLFARIEKMGIDSQEAAAGRAIVGLVSTMEYGGSPRSVQQILDHHKGASGPLAMAARSGIFLVQGDVRRALEEAGRATAKHPKSSWAFYFKAAAQEAAGDFDGAVGGAKRSVSLSPGSGVAGKLLLARIWRDEGTSFYRPGAVKRALKIIEALKTEGENRRHPAVLLAGAQTRLALCEVGTGCPCSDLGPVVEEVDKLQLSMRNNTLASDFLPRIRLVRAALLTCLRRSTAAALILPDLSKGNAGRPDLDALYATVLMKLRRTEHASVFLQRVVQRYSGWTRFYLMLARVALAKQNFAQAGKVLAAVSKEARSSAWYDLSIRLLLAQGKVAKALSVARQAVREYSDRIDVRLAQVDALLAAGKTVQAGKLAEDLFSHHPNDIRVLTTSAAILARRGEFFRAKARLDSALGRDPNNAVIRLHLGRVLVGLGKYDQARQHIKRAVANQPDLAAGWLALGQIDEGQGRFDSAVEHYRKLLKRYPKNRDGVYALARALIRVGRLDEAKKVLAGVPEELRRGRWHLLHGWLLLRKGANLARAAEELGQASRSGLRGHDLAMTLVHRAEAFLYLDQPSQSEQVLDGLDGRQRSLPEVKELWGRIWLWRGKPKRAVLWFRRALASCSQCPLWYKGRLLAYLGRAYYLRGSSGLAWAKFRRAFRLAGSDPLVSFLHGVCLYEDGREDSALRRFKAALSRDPALMEIYYYLGEIARNSGETHKAARFFRKFLRARHFGSLADEARKSLAAVSR